MTCFIIPCCGSLPKHFLVCVCNLPILPSFPSSSGDDVPFLRVWHAFYNSSLPISCFLNYHLSTSIFNPECNQQCLFNLCQIAKFFLSMPSSSQMGTREVVRIWSSSKSWPISHLYLMALAVSLTTSGYYLHVWSFLLCLTDALNIPPSKFWRHWVYLSQQILSPWSSSLLGNFTELLKTKPGRHLGLPFSLQEVQSSSIHIILNLIYSFLHTHSQHLAQAFITSLPIAMKPAWFLKLRSHSEWNIPKVQIW